MTTQTESKSKPKIKKHSNEGHEGKVAMGGSIGTIFILGLIVGGIVVFFAVAGRTHGVIEQRRELMREEMAKKAKAAESTTAPAELPAANPSGQ